MKCMFCEKSFEDYSLGMHECKVCFEKYNPFLFTHITVEGPYGKERLECFTHGMHFSTNTYIRQYRSLFEARVGVSLKVEDICILSPFDPDFGWQFAQGRGTTPCAATMAMMRDLGRFAILAIDLT